MSSLRDEVGGTCAQQGERRVAKVPGTSANLGPGFDSFGLALSLHNSIAGTVESWREATDADAAPGSAVDAAVLVSGEGAETLSNGGGNLVVAGLVQGLRMLVGAGQLAQWPDRVLIECHNKVPLARGLGSSSTALVGGIALAHSLAGIAAAPDVLRRIAGLAAGLEGHPDNVVPATVGGVTVAWHPRGADSTSLRFVRRELHSSLHPVVLVPPDGLTTAEARGALPHEVPFADAVANSARAGILLTALTQEPSLLMDATEDRLHQQYRASAYADSMEIVRHLRAQGVPSTISGAGPAVLSWLVDSDVSPGDAKESELGTDLPDGWARLDLAGSSDGVIWT